MIFDPASLFGTKCKLKITPSNRRWVFGLQSQCRPLLVHSFDLDVVVVESLSLFEAFVRSVRSSGPIVPLGVRFLLRSSVASLQCFQLVRACRSRWESSIPLLLVLRTRRTRRQSTWCGGPLGINVLESRPTELLLRAVAPILPLL